MKLGTLIKTQRFFLETQMKNNFFYLRLSKDLFTILVTNYTTYQRFFAPYSFFFSRIQQSLPHNTKHKLHDMLNSSCIVDQKFWLWVKKFSREKKFLHQKKRFHGDREKVSWGNEKPNTKRKSFIKRKGLGEKK